MYYVYGLTLSIDSFFPQKIEIKYLFLSHIVGY
jgi:hypothetical protein